MICVVVSVRYRGSRKSCKDTAEVTNSRSKQKYGHLEVVVIQLPSMLWGKFQAGELHVAAACYTLHAMVETPVKQSH